MTQTFKILSVLLCYPDEEMREAAPALRQALEADGLLGAAERRDLTDLIDDLADGDLMDRQERYVFLFDRTRSLSLHLFEHVHGESRDRGQAMVDLRLMYEQHGLEIDANELPDFLPLFLEFLSTLPLAEAQGMLAQTLHIIVAIQERLQKRDSIYARVFAALRSLANAKPNEKNLEELRQAPDHAADDFVALDRAWEEEPVSFGGTTDGSACDDDRIQTKLRAAARQATTPTPPRTERRA